jgi:hypothetical protein
MYSLKIKQAINVKIVLRENKYLTTKFIQMYFNQLSHLYLSFTS